MLTLAKSLVGTLALGIIRSSLLKRLGLHLAEEVNLPEIFHFDQGSEYRSKDLSDILIAKNIQASMSAKSSPWQNGKQESFYQKFKLELGHTTIYETRGELIEAIALQIYYYNHRRIHSALKMPPALFYQRCLRHHQTDIAKEPSKISVQNKSLKFRAALQPILRS